MKGCVDCKYPLISVSNHNKSIGKDALQVVRVFGFEGFEALNFVPFRPERLRGLRVQRRDVRSGPGHRLRKFREARHVC